MPKPRKLSLAEAERRVRALSPAAWDAASKQDRRQAVAMLNEQLAKEWAADDALSAMFPKMRRA